MTHGVASLELVGGSVLDRKVGLLDVGEGSRGVVRQSADGLSGRHEVVRVAREVGLQASVGGIKGVS